MSWSLPTHKSHTVVLLAGLALVATFVVPSPAKGMYDPKHGRWLQRDPIGVRPDAPRGTTDPHKQYTDGVSLHEYARSAPGKHADPEGLSIIGIFYPVTQWLCCQCLVYAEAGGSPACLDAVVHVAMNRQKSDWNDFKGEETFCKQAGNRKRWAGGSGNPRFDNCIKCKGNNLPQSEYRAMARAANACSHGMSGGKDPTGGAQFYWSKGRTPAWMKKEQEKGNCAPVRVPKCPLEFWKCKKRPLA